MNLFKKWIINSTLFLNLFSHSHSATQQSNNSSDKIAAQKIASASCYQINSQLQIKSAIKSTLERRVYLFNLISPKKTKTTTKSYHHSWSLTKFYNQLISLNCFRYIYIYICILSITNGLVNEHCMHCDVRMQRSVYYSSGSPTTICILYRTHKIKNLDKFIRIKIKIKTF